MAKLLALCLVAFAAVSVAAVAEEEIRIIGGTKVDKIVPYQVSIMRKDHKNLCGGSLLSSRWVLTAAHCVYGYLPHRIVVAVGSNTLDPIGSVYNVNRIHTYPGFSVGTYTHDVGLLLISSPITFSNTIQPIALDSEKIIGKVKAFVTGWGITNFNSNQYSNDLKGIAMETITNNECKSKFPTLIDDSKICAKNEDGTGHSCVGDDGGALVSNVGGKLVQIGIVSTGMPDCSAKYPVISSRISYYNRWIQYVSGDQHVSRGVAQIL